jgi:hypothetical protein
VRATGATPLAAPPEIALPDAFQPTWSGPNSIQPDDGASSHLASLRELRTRSASPAAPSIDSLFGREERDGPRPQQTVVVWDAGQSWPGFSLTHLHGASQGGGSAPARLHRVLLRQEGAREALADFLITLLPGGNEANRWGVIEVQTAPGDPLGTRVALGLLEQADRAVLLAGGPGDKDLVRRIADFSRSAPWSGPSLLLVSPADKPSRADRLRRSAWPRGLRAHVLEVFPGSEAGWTAQLLSMVLGDGAPADEGGGGGSGGGGIAPSASAATAPPSAGASAPSTARPDGLRAAETALTLATRAPGVRACAIFDAREGRITACIGALDEAGDAASRATRMLQAHGEAASLDELIWHSATRQHIVLALPAHAPLRLLAVVDRAFGELSTVRWHLAVARNQLG